MLNWAARNKYKLMVAIVGLYLVTDAWQHKGLTRVLLPKSFSGIADTSHPASRSRLMNMGKEWTQAVNTVQQMHALPAETAGLECDVYFNMGKGIFEVHHDPDRSTGLGLETLLQAYAEEKRTASVWLDLKNLNSENQQPALAALIRLRNRFGLSDKILVESSAAILLSAFSDSGFYTSFYTPMFNPYLISKDEEKRLADSLAAILHQSKLNAVSGYYFQYPYLQHYFPHYPVLTWAVPDRLSLVSWLFRRKTRSDPSVFILLYP